MRCSDLYIVGYQLDSGLVYIEHDDNLCYKHSVKNYNFHHIEIISDSTSHAQNKNLKTLHVIGFVVAESVREEQLALNVKTLIDKNEFDLDIDREIGWFQEVTTFQESSVEQFQQFNIAMKATPRSLVHEWSSELSHETFQSTGRLLFQIAFYLKNWEMFRPNDGEEERIAFAQRAQPFCQGVLDNIDAVGDAGAYGGPRIKKKSSGDTRKYVAGVYKSPHADHAGPRIWNLMNTTAWDMK